MPSKQPSRLPRGRLLCSTRRRRTHDRVGDKVSRPGTAVPGPCCGVDRAVPRVALLAPTSARRTYAASRYSSMIRASPFWTYRAPATEKSPANGGVFLFLLRATRVAGYQTGTKLVRRTRLRAIWAALRARVRRLFVAIAIARPRAISDAKAIASVMLAFGTMQGRGRKRRDARRGIKAGPDPDHERPRRWPRGHRRRNWRLPHRRISTAAIANAPCRPNGHRFSP